MKNRDFNPGDPLPSTFNNSIQEHLSGIGSSALRVRIKPSDPTTLEIPAGPGNDQVGTTIEGRWRYVTAAVEAAGAGSARTVDVWVTAADNDFAAGSPGEVDNTVYDYALVVRDVGSPPTGVDVSRKVAVADWNGSAFVFVTPLVGGQVAGERGIGVWTPLTLPATVHAINSTPSWRYDSPGLVRLKGTLGIVTGSTLMTVISALPAVTGSLSLLIAANGGAKFIVASGSTIKGTFATNDQLFLDGVTYTTS